MRYFWIRTESGKAMCVDAESEEAMRARAAEAGLGTVSVLGTLPYPAEPRLALGTPGWGRDDACPSFCYAPNQCRGRTCCPQNYSCTE